MATRPRARACIFHKTLGLMLYLFYIHAHMLHASSLHAHVSVAHLPHTSCIQATHVYLPSWPSPPVRLVRFWPDVYLPSWPSPPVRLVRFWPDHFLLTGLLQLVWGCTIRESIAYYGLSIPPQARYPAENRLKIRWLPTNRYQKWAWPWLFRCVICKHLTSSKLVATTLHLHTFHTHLVCVRANCIQATHVYCTHANCTRSTHIMSTAVYQLHFFVNFWSS